MGPPYQREVTLEGRRARPQPRRAASPDRPTPRAYKRADSTRTFAAPVDLLHAVQTFANVAWRLGVAGPRTWARTSDGQLFAQCAVLPTGATRALSVEAAGPVLSYLTLRALMETLGAIDTETAEANAMVLYGRAESLYAAMVTHPDAEAMDMFLRAQD